MWMRNMRKIVGEATFVSYNGFVKHKTIFFLILTLWSGILINQPYLEFQPLLSTSDHGRDLYCFQQTLQGKLPYRDYWWEYGPLMPYYYSLFFKILGVHIQGVLWGQFGLVVLAGLLIFAVSATMMSCVFSFLSALWFGSFRPEFFYTYNHVGGLVFLLSALYCLLRYTVHPRNYYLHAGLMSIVLTGLIKTNIGLSCLFAFLGSVLLAAPVKNKKRCVLFSFLSLLLIASVYFLFSMPMNFS